MNKRVPTFSQLLGVDTGELRYWFIPKFEVIAIEPTLQEHADFLNRMMRPAFNLWTHWWLVGGGSDL